MPDPTFDEPAPNATFPNKNTQSLQKNANIFSGLHFNNIKNRSRIYCTVRSLGTHSTSPRTGPIYTYVFRTKPDPSYWNRHRVDTDPEPDPTLKLSQFIVLQISNV
jgi:hypothetical protein